MKNRTLGRTGLEVSELGLGGLFVSSCGPEEAKKTVLRAMELGVNYIDTAPTYPNSEEVIGKALEGTSIPLVLSTKLGGRPEPFNPQKIECLMRSVEQSMKLLKRDCIDILMIHEPDRPDQYNWFTDFEEAQGPVIELLSELKEKGIVHFTGVAGTTAHELGRLVATGKFDVVLTASNYSILWREAEHEIFPAAKERNLGIIVGSPLQQGALARRYDEEIRKSPWLSKPRREQMTTLYGLLDELDIPLPELALRFTISNPDISVVLVGARSREEIEQDANWVEKGPLTDRVLRKLDDIYAMVPFRPFEEPANLSFLYRPYKGPGHVRS